MGDISKVAGQWIADNAPFAVVIGVFIFCLFFEISKIKVYPLRWLWKLISWPVRKIDEQRTESFKALLVDLKDDIDQKVTAMVNSTATNCDVLKERFDHLETRFDELGKTQSETDERLDRLAAARIKTHVLNFARQCRKGETHSHEDFANLFKENKEYEILVAKYGWENDVYIHDFAYIKRVYDEHNYNGDFAE